MIAQYEAVASAKQAWTSIVKLKMKKSIQEQSAGPRYLRTLAVVGLLVLAILFAPLGQGVGLSAGQGMIQAPDSGAAHALAVDEVERLVGRR